MKPGKRKQPESDVDEEGDDGSAADDQDDGHDDPHGGCPPVLHDPHDQESLQGSGPDLVGDHDAQGSSHASLREPSVSTQDAIFDELPAASAPMEPEVGQAQLEIVPSDQPLVGASDVQSEAAPERLENPFQAELPLGLAEAEPSQPEIGLCQAAEPAPGPPSQPEALPGAAEAPPEPDLPAQPVAPEQPQPRPAAEPEPDARRSSQRVHSSPTDILALLVPNKDFVIYLAYNDYRFKVECKTTSEKFIHPFHRKSFSKVFTKDIWKESLIAVHKHCWEKWSIISDTSPLDRARQDSIDDSVFESLQPIIDRMPPPTQY